jgi:hypothetical protein
MRFVTAYLIGYAALVLGAVFALWAGGALPHIGALRLAFALAVAVAFGLLLALASRGSGVPAGESEPEP